MTQVVDFKHPFTGAELRDGGIKVAIDHADLKHDKWSVDAMKVLDLFLKHTEGEFMGEDVRNYAHVTCGMPLPPSNRAWGGVISAAAKAKKIKFVRLDHVKNPSAHCANAAVWIKA